MADFTRITPVSYDITHKVLLFKAKEDSDRKVSVTTKSDRDIDDVARIVVLLATKCERGASVKDVLTLRDKLLKSDGVALEAAEKDEEHLVRPRFTLGALKIVGMKYAVDEKPKPTEIHYDDASRSLTFSFRSPDGRVQRARVKVKGGRSGDDLKSIIALMHVQCGEGASLDRLQSYRDELLEQEPERLREDAAPHLGKVPFADGLDDTIAAELEKQAKVKVTSRSGSIGWDSCNNNFNFEFFDTETDEKKKKITVSIKSRSAQFAINVAAILAWKCNQGASADELYAYRCELYKKKASTVEDLISESIEGGDVETLFNPGVCDRARNANSGKAAVAPPDDGAAKAKLFNPAAWDRARDAKSANVASAHAAVAPPDEGAAKAKLFNPAARDRARDANIGNVAGARLGQGAAQAKAQARTGAKRNDAGAALRAELGSMPKGALRKRAADAGVPEAAVFEAIDAEDTKAALVELVVAAEAKKSETTLLAELHSMPNGALRKRAVASGVHAAALMGAIDAEDTKSALADLIMAAEAKMDAIDPNDVVASPSPKAGINPFRRMFSRSNHKSTPEKEALPPAKKARMTGDATKKESKALEEDPRVDRVA